MVSLSTTKHNTLLPRAIRSVWFSSGLFGAVALSGAVASQQVHAFSFEDFKQVVSATASIKQADNVTAALEVVNAQTAQTPKDISDRNMEVEANVLAIKDGIQNGKEIVKSIEDFKPGVGIPNSMDCMAMEEQKDHTVKKELSNQVATAIASSNAAKFFAQEGNKRALRAKDHYSNYCDISEVAQGICLSSPNARSGMNQDYTNIFANKTMNEEQINAGYSFTRNIIDPAKTDDSFCKNVTCKALAENEKQYATLGSMIQNAFLQQIQDGVPYETPPGGAVPVVVEQLGEISPEYNGPYKLWDETAVQGGPPGDGSYAMSADFNIENLPNDMAQLLKQLSELISGHESKGSYYAMNRNGCDKTTYVGNGPYKGNPQYDFPNMTIRQISAMQNNKNCRGTWAYAIGKYQIIPGTMADFLDRGGALARKFGDQKFTPEVQEQLQVEWFLFKKQPKLAAFLKGKGSVQGAKLGLAAEWRSIGDPRYCTGPKNCNAWMNSKKDKANYENTVKIWSVLEKMDQLMKQDPANIPNKAK